MLTKGKCLIFGAAAEECGRIPPVKKGEDDQIVWNASITWRFLKKKQAEISANWVDILSQQKNYFRGTMADGLYENHTQQIGSYFIVSVKYRFNQPLHK